MDKKERFNKAYDYLVYQKKFKMQKDLAELMGMTQSSVSQAKKGVESALTVSFMRRFCGIFPEISLDWMVRGKGEMLKDPSTPATIPIKETINPPVERTAENNIIEAYALLIRDVERHHKELIEEIAAMREMRGVLEQQREEIRTIRRMLSQLLYSQTSATTLPIAAETTAQSPEAQTTPETK